MQKTRQATKESIPCVAFIGPFGSGKSYWADKLQAIMEAEYGVTVYRVSLAAELKRIATEDHHMVGKDRKLLNRLGTEMRKSDPDVLPRFLIGKIRGEGKVPFIVDDVRYPNDAEMLRKAFPNLIIVRIHASDDQRFEAHKAKYGRMPDPDDLSHPTETEQLKVKADVTIHNRYDDTTRAKLMELLDAAKHGFVLRKG